MKTLKEIIKELEEYKQEAEAFAEAWANVSIEKKKNGEAYSRLSQAVNGANFGKYTPVEDAFHPYLTITTRTTAGKWVSDSQQAYWYLDELPDTDERKKAYKPQFLRQTTPMTADKLRQMVKKWAEKWAEMAKDYAEQIARAPKAFDNYRQAIKEAEENLRADTGCGKFNNSLYYAIKSV